MSLYLIDEWIAARRLPGACASSSALFSDYAEFIRQNGSARQLEFVSNKAMAMALMRLGFVRMRTGKGSVFIGLEVTPSANHL
jgi:hypothetical protein